MAPLEPLDAELLQRQDALQAEAGRVLAELDLLPSLRALGEPELVGSAASGLMVWPDIDVTVVAPGATTADVLDSLHPVLTGRGVRRFEYRDQREDRTPSGRPEDERHYLVLHLDRAGVDWKVDVSLWVRPGPPTMAWSAERLRARLTPRDRLAILRIKEVWHKRPGYPAEVNGIDIYDAVLEHGVATPEAFDSYLSGRR